MQLPDPFVHTLEAEHPAHARRIIEGLHETGPVSIRLNPYKIKTLTDTDGKPVSVETVLEQTGKQIPWEPYGVYLEKRPVFTLDPLFHAGLYYVQEASSMVVGTIFRQLRAGAGPLRVLDLCAAPGGKSTHLAAEMKPGDLLVCNEAIRNRVALLRENCTKWGHAPVVITGNDPAQFEALGSWFDIVLVDAPCSGEGLFRKDERAAAVWSPETVAHCALRQNRILEAIWPVIKPGGYLVYSTCTFNKTENDARLDALIRTHGAVPTSIRLPAGAGFVSEKTGMGAQMYRCFPGFVPGEGFTVGVLQKPDDAPRTPPFPQRNRYVQPTERHPLCDHLDADMQTVLSGNHTFLVPAALHSDIRALSAALHIHQAGIEAGEAGRPAHALAMYHQLNVDAFPRLELDADTALRYLRRESIPADRSQAGVRRIVHRNTTLGFGKATSGRINNHYPMEWRVRMTGEARSLF